MEAVGTIGTDLNAKTSATVASVASLEIDAARASIAEIDGTLQGAATAGLIRIMAVLSVAGIAIASIVIWRRRGGRRTLLGSASTHDEPRRMTASPGVAAVSLDDEPTTI